MTTFEFTSPVPVWRERPPISSTADLQTLTKGELEWTYEQARKDWHALGIVPKLPYVPESRPRVVWLNLLSELVSPDAPPLRAPPVLRKESMPVLPAGTLLRALGSDGERSFARVESTTPAGKIRMREFIVETGARDDSNAPNSYSQHCWRTTALSPIVTMAEFVPPSLYSTDAHWTLENGGSRHDMMRRVWHLASYDDAEAMPGPQLSCGWIRVVYNH